MEARLRTVRILWGALTSTNAIYLLVIASHFRWPDAIPEHLPILLGALAFGLAIASVVLPARGFDMSLRTMKVEMIDMPGEVVGGFRESAPITRVIAEPDRVLENALTRFQTPFLLGMALAESISLFGFMLGFMHASAMVYAPFFAVGAALMLSKFPTAARIREAVERVKGASLTVRP